MRLTPKSSPGQGSGRRLGLWDHLGAEIPEDMFLGPDTDVEAAITAWESAMDDVRCGVETPDGGYPLTSYDLDFAGTMDKAEEIMGRYLNTLHPREMTSRA